MRNPSSDVASPFLIASLFLILLIFGACGKPGRELAWTGTIDTLANGAVLASNTGEGLWSAETAWSLSETCRIGGGAAEGPEQFSTIVGLTTDAARPHLYTGPPDAGRTRIHA